MVCEKCFVDKTISEYILEYGTNIKTCELCGSANVNALSCEDIKMQNLFKATIRYNFDEWEYNSHWGGDSIGFIVGSSDLIFSENAKSNLETLEDTILTLVDNVYEDYDKGISIHAGYTDGDQNTLLDAIKEGNSNRISLIKILAKKLNYYKIEKNARKIVENLASHIDNVIQFSQPLYRARIGYTDKRFANNSFRRVPYYIPYQSNSICAPPPTVAQKGRMNRENVSFLYLASDEKTAIAEIRPHPGQIVSIGQFVSDKDIRIADFASANIVSFFMNDKLLDIFEDIVSINLMFSTPVPPNSQHQYIVTQLLSDLIRSMGFDGVSYRSSVSDGTNYAFFDPSLFSYVDGSANAVYINKVDCFYTQAGVYRKSDEEDY